MKMSNLVVAVALSIATRGWIKSEKGRMGRCGNFQALALENQTFKWHT